MSEITIFGNPQFGSIRVIMRGNEPWFVAKDVAVCLGYSNTKLAILDHCKKAEVYSQFGEQPTTRGSETIPPVNSEIPANCSPLDPQTKLIPESDLYRLIMRSHLPAAEAFQDWVVEEVLPAIRKTGVYGKSPTSYLEALKQCVALEEARLAAKADLAIEQEAHGVTKKELQRALEQLGIAGDFSGVCTQSWIYDYMKSSSTTFRCIGRLLSYALRVTNTLGILSRDIPVNRWNGKITHVRVYRNDLWADFKHRIEQGLFNRYTKFIGKCFK